jgi:ankyrin repeat protein
MVCREEITIEYLLLSDTCLPDEALTMFGDYKPNWMLAVLQRRPPIQLLQIMAQKGLIQFNQTDAYSLPGIYLAHRHFDFKPVLDFLFTNGCSVDIQDDEGWTPLMTAIKHNFAYCDDDDEDEYDGGYSGASRLNALCYEQVRYLLEAGADPLLEDKDGDSPLSYAREVSAVNIVKLIEEFLM